MTKTPEKIVKMSCGHEMTEESLEKTINTMVTKLNAEGMPASGAITIPHTDVTLEVKSYDPEKFRHALSSFRYKIKKIDGLYVSLNLY